MKTKSVKRKTRNKRKNQEPSFFSGEKSSETYFFHKKKADQREVPAIQRDMPNIAMPRGRAIPNLPGLPEARRRLLTRSVQNFTDSPSRETGQRAVDAVTSYLERIGTVNFRNNPQLAADSPRFRLRPGIRASESGASSNTSGITYESNGKIRVDIFPRAFIGLTRNEKLGFLTGVIVHEYLHVLQNLAPDFADRTIAEREYQAWLWQAEHLDQLGIPPNSVTSRQIAVQLQTFFSQLSQDDQASQQRTFDSAIANLNRQRVPEPTSTQD